MKPKLRLLALAAAFVGMGLSLPSCPGQQAMQQQVDLLNTREADMNKRLQAAESEVRTMRGELNKVTTVLTQVGNTVLAQKATLEQMEAAAKARGAVKPAGKAPRGSKKYR